RREVAVTVQVEPDLPTVYGNAGHLRQVVLNLLSNAMFSAAGVAGGEVRASLARDGQGVRLTITDNGPGFTGDAATHAFDPFFTTKSHEQGTGLGLSIAHRIVTEHRGTITAENGANGGAVFCVSLPGLAVPAE
ncbi:MAG: HAMP domain-containing histidine kinase, partial [Candidatus Eremiobacteraeota bacterium]|nr:HAMP domain-containing histidine kinase [Candidatus Eremiobacteraeota bacterium]